MDISSLYNVTSGAIKKAAESSYTSGADSAQKTDGDSSFSSFLNSAVNQLDETNSYLQDQEDEEIKLFLGLSDNTHDLAVAQGKASTSLQYTVALRDRFLDAYKEIMNIQM